MVISLLNSAMGTFKNLQCMFIMLAIITFFGKFNYTFIDKEDMQKS